MGTSSAKETKIIAKYHITFIVNCKGELGKFEFRSKQRGGYNPTGLLMGPKPVILSFG